MNCLFNLFARLRLGRRCVLLLVVSVSFAGWSGCTAIDDQRDWYSLRSNQRIDDLVQHLKRFSGCRHSAEVQLLIDERAWPRCHDGDLFWCRYYLEVLPHGPHARESQANIPDRLWLQAREQNNEESWKSFLAESDASDARRAEAHRRLRSLLSAQSQELYSLARRQDTVPAWEAFIATCIQEDDRCRDSVRRRAAAGRRAKLVEEVNERRARAEFEAYRRLINRPISFSEFHLLWPFPELRGAGVTISAEYAPGFLPSDERFLIPESGQGVQICFPSSVSSRQQTCSSMAVVGGESQYAPIGKLIFMSAVVGAKCRVSDEGDYAPGAIDSLLKSGEGYLAPGNYQIECSISFPMEADPRKEVAVSRFGHINSRFQIRTGAKTTILLDEVDDSLHISTSIDAPY